MIKAPILEVKNLNITFNKNANNEKIIVENGNFSVSSGEIVLILGDNGVGKSTILEALIFALEDNATYDFDMVFNGCKITSNEKDYFRKCIGLSEQTFSDGFFNQQKVGNYVQNYFMSSFDSSGCSEYYEKLYNDYLKCNLYSENKLNNKRLKICSPGEKQMISILCAFSRKNSKLFILDEPINNLDSKHARLLNNYIINLKNQENPPGILIVTHCQMFQNVDKAYLLKNRKLSLVENYVPKSCYGECNSCGLYEEE